MVDYKSYPFDCDNKEQYIDPRYSYLIHEIKDCDKKLDNAEYELPFENYGSTNNSMENRHYAAVYALKQKTNQAKIMSNNILNQLCRKESFLEQQTEYLEKCLFKSFCIIFDMAFISCKVGVEI